MDIQKTQQYKSAFDLIAKSIMDDEGNTIEVWYARELQQVLSYSQWENFVVAIGRAKGRTSSAYSNHNTDTKTKQAPIESEPIDFEYDEIDRPKIVNFINDRALPSYLVRSFQMNDYLNSLFALGRFLLLSRLDINANEGIVEDIVERINTYVMTLKHTGKYPGAKEKIVNFEMLASVYDAFRERIKTDPIKNMFSESDIDIEQQFRIAEKKLCNEDIGVDYGRKNDNPDSPGSLWSMLSYLHLMKTKCNNFR